MLEDVSSNCHRAAKSEPPRPRPGPRDDLEHGREGGPRPPQAGVVDLSPAGLLASGLQARLEEALARLAMDRRCAVVDRGVMPIGRCYGYARDAGAPGRLRIDPNGARQVLRAFQMRALGAGLGRIAQVLGESGAAGTWSSSRVSAILRNPLYRGVIVGGRQSRRVDGTGQAAVPAVRRPRTVENPDLRVVPPLLWHAAQAADGRRPSRPGRPVRGRG